MGFRELTVVDSVSGGQRRAASILESEMDDALCEAIAASPSVSALFGANERVVRTSQPRVDEFGEVDVLVEWGSGLEAHIENKIDAAFQPDQPERYKLRADGSSSDVLTVVCAPLKYLRSHPVQRSVFSSSVSYEQIVTALDAERSLDAVRLRSLFALAIEKNAGAHDDRVTGLFDQFGGMSEAAGLPWLPGNTGKTGRGFFTVRTWRSVQGRKVEVSAKLAKGKIDIHVRRAGHVLEDARRLWAGSSAQVRLASSSRSRDIADTTLIVGRLIEPVSPYTASDERQPVLDQAIHVAEDLVCWWITGAEQQLSELLAVDRSIGS